MYVESSQKSNEMYCKALYLPLQGYVVAVGNKSGAVVVI